METVGSLNIVPSPLETLSLNLNPLSYGLLTAFSSVWAWFAALTAAVSFWRMTALTPSPEATRGRKASRGEAAEPPRETDSSSPARGLLTAKATSLHASDGEGSPKVKFCVYYRGEAREDDDRYDNDCKENGSNNDNDCNKNRTLRYCDNVRHDWKRSAVVRMGDMGWYTWQDLSVLDGSVVRLWDVRRGPTYSAVKAAVGGGCW